MIHELKSWPEFFEPLACGARSFDMRINDRDYRVGDTVVLREFDRWQQNYSGRGLRRRIGSILSWAESRGKMGLQPEHVVLQLVEPEDHKTFVENLVDENVKLRAKLERRDDKIATLEDQLAVALRDFAALAHEVELLCQSTTKGG